MVKQCSGQVHISKKSGNKKYAVDWNLFAEWDYKDVEDAFEHAKDWLLQQIVLLTEELKEMKENA